MTAERELWIVGLDVVLEGVVRVASDGDGWWCIRVSGECVGDVKEVGGVSVLRDGEESTEGGARKIMKEGIGGRWSLRGG